MEHRIGWALSEAVSVHPELVRKRMAGGGFADNSPGSGRSRRRSSGARLRASTWVSFRRKRGGCLQMPLANRPRVAADNAPWMTAPMVGGPTNALPVATRATPKR